jgi:hypothetical protein
MLSILQFHCVSVVKVPFVATISVGTLAIIRGVHMATQALQA